MNPADAVDAGAAAPAGDWPPQPASDGRAAGTGSVGDPPRPPADAAERSRQDQASQDLALLRRAAEGDGRAFNELVERHARPMFRLAYLLTGSNADAEDVLQETWTGVFKSLRRFEGRSTVKTWLTRILTTQVALWRRKRKGGTLSLEEAPTAEADALPRREAAADRQSDWQADLKVALQRLSSDHREVIVLREIEQLSYDEIAEALRVPRGTVESRLHRARGELRKHLQAYLE